MLITAATSWTRANLIGAGVNLSYAPSRRVRFSPLAVLGLAWMTLFASGCASDTRLSVAMLQEMESAAARTEPVEVELPKLQLSDFRPYRVGPGDVLWVTINGLNVDDPYAETRLRVRIHESGQINIPEVGPIDVTGLTLAEVERVIIGAHVPRLVKALSVFASMDVRGETTVLVVGAAGQRGLITLERNKRNILYALAKALGINAAASGRVRLRPIRPDSEDVMYDLTDANDLRRALLAPPLEPGDMIVVEAAPDTLVYVNGLVNAPGAIPIPVGSEISTLRAIASAGGLRDLLEPESATLYRVLRNGEQVRVKLDIADMIVGDVPDFALRSGDILEIPHTPETRFREWVVNNIFVGPFGVSARYDPIAEYRFKQLRDDDNNNGGGFFRGVALDAFGAGFADLLNQQADNP